MQSTAGSGDTYAKRIMQKNVELIEQWTREQSALRQLLVFNDSNLNFSAKPRQTKRAQASAGVDDFDQPTVYHCDPASLQITGLRYVGGLDISFTSAPDDTMESRKDAEVGAAGGAIAGGIDAFATLVVVEFPSLELRHSITHPIHMDVPYIPTFLSYREAPAYLRLIDALRAELVEKGLEDHFPQVFLVDGNGRLHIRETGVASVVGVQANVPTIGVAKTFLPHHPNSLPPELTAKASNHWRSSQHGMRQMIRHVLRDHGSWFGLYNPAGTAYAGAALIPATSKVPLFVSPGHRVSLETAIAITLAMGKYRIPEPIRLADKISRAAAASRTWSS